jgi:hypothetical protein
MAPRDGRLPIVYIHGVGDQEPATELKRSWDLALFGQDMGSRTSMAYWADLTRPTSAARRRTRSALVDRDLGAAELLKDAELPTDDEAAQAFTEALAERLASGGTRGRGGPSAKALPLPGFLRRPIARRFLKAFVPDTAAYFFRKGMRARMQKRFTDQLPPAGQPFVVVAHSMGTVISLEALAAKARRSHDVALYVTLGSPLGIQEVQDFLEAEQRIPACVRSWHNFADTLDPVALDKALANDFAPNGIIRDHRVVNERSKEILRFNPHSSFGYLAHPSVRREVHQATSFDSMGRFVVARDVAESFISAEGRQPVLIEALEPGYNALGEGRGDRSLKHRDDELPDLPSRIGHLATALRGRLKQTGVDPETEGRVDELRRFVAAHLTPAEVSWLAEHHADFGVYSVWRSAEKRKLLDRSHGPLKADAARNSYQASGRGVTWAVLDTGARFDHPHFDLGDGASVIDAVYDCTRPGKPKKITNPKKADPDGHGSHVAGIVAGWSEDERYQGVAPDARLVVYKVLDDEGAGEDAWIIKALDHIAKTNASASGLLIHGVNLSLGGWFDPTVYGCGHSPICQELRSLWRAGVLVCVSAGNEGQIEVQTADETFDLNTQLSIGDPANLEECIAVGSVNASRPHTFGVSYFSSRGPTADGRAKPDVVAPGERIRSCDSAFEPGDPKSWYRADSGTSMACPHVSGLLAAFLSVRREFIGRPDEVKRILLENANDLARDRYHQGAGLPNLMKMLLNT